MPRIERYRWHGSIEVISANVEERYAYDAFGKVRFMDGNYDPKVASPSNWAFLFHCEFLDLESAMYNYGFRYYNSQMGRWLSRDPLDESGGVNLYAFVNNRGVNRIDILGLDTFAGDRTANFDTGNPNQPDDQRISDMMGQTYSAIGGNGGAEFNITDTFFNYAQGKELQGLGPGTGQIAMVVRMTLSPLDGGSCTGSYKIIQFIREMQYTGEKMSNGYDIGWEATPDQGHGDRKKRSTSSGWKIDSPKSGEPNAGCPFYSDTKFGSAPAGGKPGTMVDTPQVVVPNRGFDVYTCLACCTGNSVRVLGCLFWSFQVMRLGKNKVPGRASQQVEPFQAKLRQTPVGQNPYFSAELRDIIKSSVNQWNQVESNRLNLNENY